MVVWREMKERIKGKSGSQRIHELRVILDELPGYKTGPYAEIRKWIYEQMDKTRSVARIKHKDWLGVERRGEAQIAILGQPNVGKSSLIAALTGKQVKIADYAFTTLKPIEAVMKFEDIEVQIIDLPGVIEGASEDKGGGKRLLGIAKCSDGIILMHDSTKPVEDLQKIAEELKKANSTKPIAIICNKVDMVQNVDEQLKLIEAAFPGCQVIAISAKAGIGLEKARQTIWQMTGLIKVYTHDGKTMALAKPALIRDFSEKIHKDFVSNFKAARIWGSSAKFPGQQVGLEHELQEGDRVELLLKR
jgi:small GTP-binding protein